MKEYAKINNRPYLFEVSKENIHIDYSYETPKRDFDVVLDYLEEHYSDRTDVLKKRSRHCLKMEWACHNLLYKIGICRKMTKDVDLDKNDKYKVLYHLFGWIACLLIK